jgi:hypothetical protein
MFPRTYGQPGLLYTPQNFAQSSKFLGKIFFGTKATSEAFLSISQNLKVTRLQGGTQTKLWTCWRNFDLSRSFECFWGSFMVSLCSSKWSDQKCCKTECVVFKLSFQTRPMWALQTHFLARHRFLKQGSKFCIFTKLWKCSTIFHGRTIAVAAMNMVSTGGFRG